MSSKKKKHNEAAAAKEDKMKKPSFIWIFRFFAVGLCLFGLMRGVVLYVLLVIGLIISDITIGPIRPEMYRDDIRPDKLSAAIGLGLAAAVVFLLPLK